MSAPARNSAELVAALVAGAALGFAAARLLRRHNRSQPPTGLRPEHVLRSVAELRSFVPSGAGGSTVEDAKKMRRHLDAQRARRSTPRPELSEHFSNSPELRSQALVTFSAQESSVPSTSSIWP